MDAKEFGCFITALRDKRGLKQMDVAPLLNVTPQAVSKWERGTGVPDISSLLMIANIYQVTIDSLLLQKEESWTGTYILDSIKLGDSIRCLRKKRKLSQKKLATLLGVTFQSVSKWEMGESIPQIPTLMKMGTILKTTLHKLFTYVPIEKKRRSKKSDITKYGTTLGLIGACLIAPVMVFMLTHAQKEESTLLPRILERVPDSSILDTNEEIFIDEEIDVITYLPEK